MRTFFLIGKWERLGYCSMQVLMVAYMIRKLGFFDTQSNLLWSAAAALIQATRTVGGWIGDKPVTSNWVDA
jgi:POT family proton-dependent oligopeptide transporter